MKSEAFLLQRYPSIEVFWANRERSLDPRLALSAQSKIALIDPINSGRRAVAIPDGARLGRGPCFSL